MKKKKILCTLLFVVLVTTGTTTAQQLYVSTGLAKASFEKYINSSGGSALDNSGYIKPEESLFESGLRFKIYKQRLHFGVGLEYNKYTINTSFYSGNLRIPTTYNLSYIGLKAGLTYDAIRWKKLKVQAHIGVSNSWLIFGTNRFRNVFVDIYKERTLNRILASFNRGLGLEYEVSKKISAFLNYTIASSFNEINQDSNKGETYSLKTTKLSIGLLFDITKKSKK